MPRRTVAVPAQEAPLLDLVSHGRRGPGEPGWFSAARTEAIARTVRRTPEVVVKVSGGARDAGAARAHIDYIDRHGRLPVLTDEGDELLGRDAGARLADDWHLGLSRGQHRGTAQAGGRDTRPRLALHIVLSMPGRTAPGAVLAAAAEFARERFALQHRYALVLHTDQAHPHVHLVVKAEREGEPGRRLRVDRAVLRGWREDFAAALRRQGVAANATPRVVRGEPGRDAKDTIRRRVAAQSEHAGLPEEERCQWPPPRESTFLRARVEQVARGLQAGMLPDEPGRVALARTREAVRQGWLATAQALRAQGEAALAGEVEAYVRTLPQARTQRECIAEALLNRARAGRERERGREEEPRQR